MSGQNTLTAEHISVVIPSYNHEKYIESAVMSVVNQTVANVEIVIVDDGSTDNSIAVCTELGRKYPQIRLITQSNQGAHNALNHAVSLANGKYIAVLNSDDLFEPTKIEDCLDVLNARPEVEFVVGSAVIFVDENGRVQNNGISVDWHNRAKAYFKETRLLGLSLLNENFVVTTSNMVFSKSFWQSVSGFQALRYCHDLEFLLEASRKVVVNVCDRRAQIRYRVHPQNTIKEQVSKVRVEIAAVVAQAIVESRMNLIACESTLALSQFRSFLRNKNISDLVVFLIMKYLELGDKASYYREVFVDEKKISYFSLLD